MSNHTDFWKTVEAYLGDLCQDEAKVKEVTQIIVNRGYDHYLLFFAMNPERIETMQKALGMKS